MAVIGYVDETDFTAYAAARGITLLRPTSETLTQALDYVEVQSYSGSKTESAQVLEFPRNGDTAVPNDIINAQMQGALVYDTGGDLLAPNVPKVLEQTVFGAVSRKFSDKGGNTTTYPYISALLAPYLNTSGGNNFGVARG